MKRVWVQHAVCCFYVLFLMSSLFQSSSAQTKESNSDTAKNAAAFLIQRVATYSQAHPESPGSLPDWFGATAGAPILVHSYPGLSPLYYMVPVTTITGTVIARIGIDASTFECLWYRMCHASEHTLPFLPYAAHQKMKTFCRDHNIGELRAHCLLIEFPDMSLYWYSASREVAEPKEELFIPLRGSQRVHRKFEIAPALEQSVMDFPKPHNRRRVPHTEDRKRIDLPPAYIISNVPFHYQETGWYCGEACLQMLFDYYGPLISQEDIGDAANEDPSYGTYRDDLLRAAHFSSISTAIQNPSLIGYRERELGYEATEAWWSDPEHQEFRYEDLKHLICQDYPIILGTWGNISHTSRHYRLLTGYNDSLEVFIFHDPWPDNGPDFYIPQGILVDNLWLVSDRWGCFVAPWLLTMNVPDQVSTQTVFTVSCSVTYLGPSLFEGQYVAADAQVTLSLPQGYMYEEMAPTQMCPSIGPSGTQGAVSWTVRSPASSSVFDTIRVQAKGLIQGFTESYGPYSDWIGGTASSVITAGNNIFYYVDYSIDDDTLDGSDGNSDHVADAGETVEILIDIGFIGDGPSENITASLSLAQPNPYVSLIDDTGHWNDIEGDTALSCNDGFILAISPDCQHDDTASFSLRVVDADNRTLETAFDVPLNAIADILLVCDDGQGNSAAPYINSLTLNGDDFDTWDVPSLDHINERTLARHTTIIWFTGQEEESTLTELDQNLLADFLDTGGALFISGQNIGQDLVQQEHGLNFYTNYLHAHFVSGTSSNGFLEGIPGDPISGQYNMLTLDGSQNSPDAMSVLQGAHPVFTYLSSDESAALRYSGDYRLIYFAFGFEGLTETTGTSEELRRNLLDTIIQWLGYEQTMGDVNEDGQVNIIDVIWTVNIVLGLISPTPIQHWAADFNEDGAVNILDAVAIVNSILGS
ncbi:MAG: C39 family peptidase [Gemmatimonadota bacterium]|nr:MAG: C39 family peptidase [Gemmatimonadota bacterium]